MTCWIAHGGAGGRVFLVNVVALENLAGVVVAHGRGGGAGNIEEEIHSDGEVGGVDESRLVPLDEGADAVEVFVPTGGAHDHILAGSGAGFDVGQDDMRCGEVDDGVDVAQVFWCQEGAGSVLRRSDRADLVLALSGYFRGQRSCFASA